MYRSHDDGGRLIMVVGLQYGSEGKGAIASYLAPALSMGVRTGAANAGHTIYHRGKKFTMRQIPTAWVNPYAKLVIGRGAMISLPLLVKEIRTIGKHLPISSRLFIDAHAHVIQDEHIAREAKCDLAERIGSTSARAREGIGEATAAKVLREDSCVLAKDVPELKRYMCDTVDLINTDLDLGQLVLLEGTQGFGLSLEHGWFPYVTSRDVSAAGLAASVGVAPHSFETEVIGVARTYPIRVAGNSGPFGDDAQELEWTDVTQRAGSTQPIVEHTSVTKQIRRVAEFSRIEFARACTVNRPTEIALTFADYLDWSVHERARLTERIETFILGLESLTGVPVTLIQTGPTTTIDDNWYRRSMLRKLSV